MAKSNRKVKVDMSGVESYTRCPEGEWLAKLARIEVTTVQGSGDDALKAVFEVIKGEAKGNQVFETFSLSEKALWKLKSFLVAVGVKADGKLSLDLDKLEGKICVIDVVHNEYNGSKRANISSYSKPSNSDEDDEDDEEYDDEDEDEEEEPAPKKSKKSAPAKKSKKIVEDDDEDDEDDEEEEEEEEEDPKPKKPSKKSAKKTAKPSKKKQPEPEDDEDDDDDDDDWEEDDD